MMNKIVNSQLLIVDWKNKFLERFNSFQLSINNYQIAINHSWHHQAGFTLIEILVAATIIGLLSTIGISGFQAVTRSGRDALRKTDLEQIRSALEIYKSENDRYPDATNCVADLSTDYINPYPSDPKPASYQYCYVLGSGNLSYQLCAHLENGEDSDTGCGGGNKCTSSCNYQVVNP